MTRTLLSLGALASLVLPAASAFAADKAACIDAAEKGQTLRRGHQLIEARDQFRICAGQDCPGVVQKDCATWLESIGSRIPSVVVTAKDGDGAPLIEVRVSVDGTVVRTRLDGLSFSLNPGEHAFHFELADGTALDRQVLVTEGQKSQTVDVVLGKPSAKPAAAPPEGTAAPLAETPPGASRSSGGATAGWVVGAVGVVGLGLGTYFGLAAIGDKNRANCADKLCDAGPLGSAKTAATASDVALGAGAVLVATGLALVLLLPHGHESAGRVTLTPSVATNAGGVLLGGAW